VAENDADESKKTNPETAPEGDAAEGVEAGEGDVVVAAAPAAAVNRGTVDELAKRVAALGEEDDSERQARLEEEKLEARKTEARKAKKKGALENAASKKLDAIGDGSKPKKKKAAVAAALEEEDDDAEVQRVVTAKAYSDPLIDQTRKLSEWAGKNKTTVTYGVLALVAAVAAGFGYAGYQQKIEVDASQGLAKAVLEERGRIGEPDKEDDEQQGPADERPVFKDVAARQDSALGKFRGVTKSFPGTGAAILARLSEGGLLLDKGSADDAIAAFTEVKGSALAKADTDVRGRALEGLGFAQELKGETKAALATFKEMESSVDVVGFKELAMFHQARCHELLGEKDKAKEILLSIRERTAKSTEMFAYLRHMVDDRVRAIDPKAIPDAPSMPGMGMPGMGGPGGANSEQMRQIQEMMRKMKMKGGSP
jgi:hypothetical protein